MFPPNFNNYHEFVCHLIKLTNLLLWINLKVVKRKKKIRNNIPRLYTLNYYKTHVDFLIKFLIKKKLPVINSLYSHKFLINSNLTHQNPQILSHTCLTRSYHLPISIPNFILFKDVAKNSHVQNSSQRQTNFWNNDRCTNETWESWEARSAWSRIAEKLRIGNKYRGVQKHWRARRSSKDTFRRATANRRILIMRIPFLGRVRRREGDRILSVCVRGRASDRR